MRMCLKKSPPNPPGRDKAQNKTRERLERTGKNKFRVRVRKGLFRHTHKQEKSRLFARVLAPCVASEVCSLRCDPVVLRALSLVLGRCVRCVAPCPRLVRATCARSVRRTPRARSVRVRKGLFRHTRVCSRKCRRLAPCPRCVRCVAT